MGKGGQHYTKHKGIVKQQFQHDIWMGAWGISGSNFTASFKKAPIRTIRTMRTMENCFDKLPRKKIKTLFTNVSFLTHVYLLNKTVFECTKIPLLLSACFCTCGGIESSPESTWCRSPSKMAIFFLQSILIKNLFFNLFVDP